MSKEILIPFRLSPDGTIATETNPDRRVRQHVNSLVLTEPSERVMLPTYGVPLTSFVFELDDDIIQSHMLELVKQAMAVWEPGVEVRSISQVKNEHGDGLAMIQVSYMRRDSAANNLPGAKVNVAFIDLNGKVTETVKG
jgi:phage baseplate assembly protein W